MQHINRIGRRALIAMAALLVVALFMFLNGVVQ
jgi:hypothetical protein